MKEADVRVEKFGCLRGQVFHRTEAGTHEQNQRRKSVSYLPIAVRRFRLRFPRRIRRKNECHPLVIPQEAALDQAQSLSVFVISRCETARRLPAMVESRASGSGFRSQCEKNL